MGFVLAVAPDGQVGLVRQPREQLDQMPRLGRGHLLAVRPGESCPTLGGPRVGERPRDQVWRRRKLGKPDIEVVSGREVFLPDSAGWPAHGSDPEAFRWQARRAESDDVNCHGSCGWAVFLRRWSGLALGAPNQLPDPFSDCRVRQTTHHTEKRLRHRGATAVRQARVATGLHGANNPCRNQHRAPPGSNRRESSRRWHRRRNRLARDAAAVRGRRARTGLTLPPPGSRRTPPTARPMRRLAGGFWPSMGRCAPTASESSSRRR